MPSTPAGDAPFWSWSSVEACSAVASTEVGLASDEAARRLTDVGPNLLGHAGTRTVIRLLLGQFANPIILILIAATVLSMVVGDPVDGAVILVIIVASGAVGFWQEHRAGRAVAELSRRVRVHTELLRDGRQVSVPVDEVVPGDVVLLRAGDIVPADARVLQCRSLLVDESALTGESFPAEKDSQPVPGHAPLADRRCAVFAGTYVVSGTGRVIVQTTGPRTIIGAISAGLAQGDVTTAFERGATAFGRMLVVAMLILVSGVLVVNIVLDRPLVESVLFSLALAVGITPQLLPAIVAVSLATGARRLAEKRVLVKRLDALEDFGSMTVLACDKTGTLTQGVISLDAAVDLRGHASAEVLRLAVLNAATQRGYPNPLDDALTRAGAVPGAVALAEVPYDFQRKRLSVLVDEERGPIMITKGAFDQVRAVCSHARVGRTALPIDQAQPYLERHFADLTARGFRVLAVATRTLVGTQTITAADETDLTLVGLLAFQDPIKQDARAAIEDLRALGVRVIVITGDHRLAAAQTARRVGLEPGNVLTGSEIAALSDEELLPNLDSCDLFAQIEPMQKVRIVRLLRARGACLGLLGDGINDAAALQAADVGISVDHAVDVARQAASIVLLDKDLRVVADGIRLGRATFANTLKYVRVTISANFGNVLSMAAASAFLPFLPMLPLQILLLNFMSDIPALTIAEDSVDPEDLQRPRSWEIRSIVAFMVTFGAVSSLFDIATFAVLRLGFDAPVEAFRSGWLIESTATELVAMLVLRTSRPFWRSRPGSALLWSSLAVAAVTLLLPYSPVAPALGLAGLSTAILLAIAGMIVGYVVANEVVKAVRRAHPAVSAG